MTVKVVSLWVIFRDVDTLLKSGGGAFDGSFSQKKTRGAHGTFYFNLAKKVGGGQTPDFNIFLSSKEIVDYILLRLTE